MKNFIAISFLIFIYGCGYTSVLKDQKMQDFMINIKNMQGDSQTNQFMNNQLKLASNPSSTKYFDIEIKSKYNKEIITKNSAGVATDYKINIDLEFTVLSKNNLKKIYRESFNIKNNSKNFENSNYEREIKKNFASSTKDKFILYLISINDN
tara:strand:+ start:239 stop:694 length:456 start_codon:yes stop_codon:yes gene_type:complete